MWGGVNERIGCIEINDNVFIGSNTTILYDVRIGSNVIIGAGSLVNKDVPDNSVVAGVPARVICSFNDYIEKRKKEEFYPEDIKPKNEEVCPQLARLCWDLFEQKNQ